MEVVASTTLTATPPVPTRWHYSWQFYSLCYLIAIGLLTHLVVAWLGYKLCRQWVRDLLNPPRSPKGDSKGAEEMEDEAWQEPWDMDGEYETMAWTPTDGLRYRSLESPGPTPWANMLARLDGEARGETMNTSRATERDTPSSMRSPGERRPRRREVDSSEGRNSPPLREAVRESGDMLWLVTRRLNSKDSWQL